MNVAIIVAAGQGLRMGGDCPKQFLELAGVPVIIRTLSAFEQCDAIDEIVLVLPAGESANFLSLASKHGVRKVTKIVGGGSTRADSVRRGLEAIRPATAEIVAVHDGVRPLVTADEISKVVNAAREHGAALLVAPVTDTIKQVEGEKIVRTVDRSSLRRALTPQCFQYQILKRAFDQADVIDPTLTDESVLVERSGVEVVIIEGSSRNIKITAPEDLIVAEELIKQ
jgi:2-C-methyl-D-erythritol 4-phosphate cytidylyltransferase